MGDNGPDKLRQSFRFLEAVLERCDRIVIPTGTAFTRKMWDLCKRAERDQRLRGIVRFFLQKFAYNSSKSEKSAPPANPPEGFEARATIKPDDYYLVLSFQQSQADRLNTTDQPLISALQDLGIPVVHRDDFLGEYLDTPR